MKIADKSFFINDEVLFIGYSRDAKSMSRHVAEAFRKNGIKVIPMNRTTDEGFDTKVYSCYSQLSEVPDTAYVILNKKSASIAFDQLKHSGVKRILFHSNGIVTKEMLADCDNLDIEVKAHCPMMIFGGGIHKLHRFFAGLGK